MHYSYCDGGVRQSCGVLSASMSSNDAAAAE